MVWAALTEEQQGTLNALPRLSQETQAATKEVHAEVGRAKRAAQAVEKTKAENFGPLNDLLAKTLLKKRKYKRRAVRRSEELRRRRAASSSSSGASECDGSATSSGEA